MEAGCSLHVSNKEGETALHVAAVRGYYTIVRFLCGKGANMDAQDKVREREREGGGEGERLECVKIKIFLVCIDWLHPSAPSNKEKSSRYCPVPLRARLQCQPTGQCEQIQLATFT